MKVSTKLFNQQQLKNFSSLNEEIQKTQNKISTGKNILLASISGYFIGIIVSFILAKSWVFKNISTKPLVKSFSLFCLIYFLGGIEMSLVIVFLNRLIENYKIAWFFGALIGSINNYLGSKYLSFKK